MDSLHDIVMRIGGADLDEDVSVADNDRTAASPRYSIQNYLVLKDHNQIERKEKI